MWSCTAACQQGRAEHFNEVCGVDDAAVKFFGAEPVACGNASAAPGQHCEPFAQLTVRARSGLCRVLSLCALRHPLHALRVFHSRMIFSLRWFCILGARGAQRPILVISGLGLEQFSSVYNSAVQFTAV